MTAPTRESFFALYWDHGRALPLTTMCVLAKFPKEEMHRLALTPWDELLESERERLRAAILDLIDVHDHNRRIEAKARELRGRVAA